MFNAIKDAVFYGVLSAVLVYLAGTAVGVYLQLRITPQRINARIVHPKAFKYALEKQGHDPLSVELLTTMYENGEYKVDENGMLI